MLGSSVTPSRFVALAAPSVAVAAFALGLIALPGADCTGTQCQCFPCTSAIDLNVTDATGAALDAVAWSAEATLDGAEVQDASSCEPGTRVGSQCSFGTAPGLYRITIRAPGFETREIAARFAAKSGDDCCRCLTETKVTAILIAAGEGEGEGAVGEGEGSVGEGEGSVGEGEGEGEGSVGEGEGEGEGGQ